MADHHVVFAKFEILTAGFRGLSILNTHHLAEFHQNWLSHNRDIVTIFAAGPPSWILLDTYWEHA